MDKFCSETPKGLMRNWFIYKSLSLIVMIIVMMMHFLLNVLTLLLLFILKCIAFICTSKYITINKIKYFTCNKKACLIVHNKSQSTLFKLHLFLWDALFCMQTNEFIYIYIYILETRAFPSKLRQMVNTVYKTARHIEWSKWQTMVKHAPFKSLLRYIKSTMFYLLLYGFLC